RRAWALFLSRVVPVVRTYAGFGAGLLRFPVPMFVAVTFVGSLVWCVPFVALGAVLGENWDVIETPAKVLGLAVLAVFLGVLLLGFLGQRSAKQPGQAG